MGLAFVWGSCSVGVLASSYVCVFLRFWNSRKKWRVDYWEQWKKQNSVSQFLWELRHMASLSTSLPLRAARERGLLIRTLIPDTPSACSVYYWAKYFIIHCAFSNRSSSLNACINSVQNEHLPSAKCKSNWLWWVNAKIGILSIWLLIFLQ